MNDPKPLNDQSPKEKFLASPNAAKFAAHSETPEFNAACDYALLEMMDRQDRASDVARAWDAHSRLAGAREAIEILKHLSFPETVARRKPWEGLKPQP